MITFQWNLTKANTNLKKHGISFEEAKSVFYDEFATQFYDENHSDLEEDRFLLLGISSYLNVLLVCYSEHDSDEVIRIISARKATKNERKHYLKGDSQ